jgi:hypothetical protein
VKLLTLLLLLTPCLWSWPGTASSQVLGVNYSWSDSITVNVIGRDSLFATVWESVNIWFRGGEGYIKYALNTAGDTTGWNSKRWVRLADNQIISFDAGTKLRRLQFKSATGTAVIYFVGYKKVRQF